MADAPAELKQALAHHYLIERELGVGGMATVYLATDLKHPRKVAIKVLRPELAAVLGAERFVQEVRVTAALQHPQILGLIDSGIVDTPRGSIPYYVMPYVEGESLRAKLTRETQLPIDEAVRITAAVASALDYAHRHGVIHRDIKPENILLHEGQPLVADFGIALALETAGGSRLTETGLALGTPQYMSPEQGLGERDITARSDVYALGSVAYEMLAGEPPFTGPTAQAIIAKASHDTPRPLRLGRPAVSPSIETAVAKALEKLPADRFASAGEFAAALTGSASRSSGGRTEARAGWQWGVPAIVVLGAFAAGLAGSFWLRPSPPAPDRVTRFEIPLPPDIPARENITSRIALAPDGSSLVYLGITDGIRRLFVRRLDQTVAQPLAGTEGATTPFYSPDGRWLGFMVGTEMRKVPLAGGPPVRITNWSGGVTGASWGDRGVIAFTSWADRGLWRVPSDGGAPVVVTRPDSAENEAWFLDPDFLPGGELVMFSIGFSQIGVVNLRTRKTVQLALPGASRPHFAGNDWVVFSDGDEQAVRLDLASLRILGPRVPLHIDAGNTISGTEVAVSREGTLIYVADKQGEDVTLVLVDRHGLAVPLADKASQFRSPRMSPDGKLVAVVVRQPNGSDVWIQGVGRPNLRQLTFDGHAWAPAWTPNGTMVTYSSDTISSYDVTNKLMWTRADGTGSPRPLSRGRTSLFPSTWTADGRNLIASDSRLRQSDIWRIPADTLGAPAALFRTPFFEWDGSVSPDGRWLAYTSNESDQWEVWVRRYPSMDGLTMVSLGGGLTPVWDRSGKELYYRSGSRLYSAKIIPGPAFAFERTILFESPNLRSAELERDYDVSPDGTHFVMLRRADPLEKLEVVLHWDRALPPR